jgi:UDP-glucose 4-epimerase
MNTVLVTGGAGYIGSHVVQQLLEQGERVVVIDNLSTGFREAVRGAELVVGNVGDLDLVGQVMAAHHVDAVLHFAAHTPSCPNRYAIHSSITATTPAIRATCLPVAPSTAWRNSFFHPPRRSTA